MLQEPTANTWDQWVSIISMANITRVHHPPSWLLSHIRKLNLLVFLWEIYYVPLLLLLAFFSFTICNTLVRWSPVLYQLAYLQSVYILNSLRALLDWLLDFIGWTNNPLNFLKNISKLRQNWSKTVSFTSIQCNVGRFLEVDELHPWNLIFLQVYL